MQAGHHFWRSLTRHVDIVIKANCIAQVIPSAHAIAMEILRQQHENNVEEHGTNVSRERWTQHTTLTGMVRDSGLAFRGTDDGGREAYCPVCLKYRAGDGLEVVNVCGLLHVTRKFIRRHLATQRHKQALAEEHREATRGVRRHGWD
jgi:hypothetical protein